MYVCIYWWDCGGVFKDACVFLLLCFYLVWHFVEQFIVGRKSKERRLTDTIHLFIASSFL